MYSNFNQKCTLVILKYLQACQTEILYQQVLDTGNHNILNVQTQKYQFEASCLDIKGLQAELIDLISSASNDITIKDEVIKAISPTSMTVLCNMLNSENLMESVYSWSFTNNWWIFRYR